MSWEIFRGDFLKKVAFHTLGCKVNQYETEAMEELFEREGYELVGEEDFADVYVINTCTVTNMSDRKSRQFIRRAKRLNKDSILAVVGCYSQTSPEEIEEIEGVDVILGTSSRNRIVELCQEAGLENKRINMVKDIRQNREFEKISINDLNDMTRAYIKIQDGCNQYCSYCIIPYARGPIRSRDIEDIYEEVVELAAKGFKEIILTGIHVASFGKDFEDSRDLKDLIGLISTVDGIERIRFSSVEPRLIDHDFMKVLVESGKCCDHFHLSLQSGSDTVLKRMNRKYDRAEYREKVDLIRHYMPEAGITTDIIVGFPGETEEEFQETMDFVEEIGFSRLHVFKYSKREGTPAASMENQIDGNTQQERSARLIDLGERTMEDFAKAFIGRTLKVLVEENSDGRTLEGYTSNYLRVSLDYNPDLIGRIIELEIVGLRGDLLVGKPVDM